MVSENNDEVSPERVLDICLDHVGSLSIHDDTRSKLLDYALENGSVRVSDNEMDDFQRDKISGIVKLIASTPEFQKS